MALGDEKTMKISQQVENILHHHIRHMLERFREFLQEATLSGKVTSGVGASDSGVVAAFLEYSPWGDPAEEVLDAIIDVTLVDDEVHYEADVCMSSGEVLAAIVSKSIHYSTDQELLSFVDEQTSRTRDELLQQLMAFAKTLSATREGYPGNKYI
jgi:hypothetical protein